MLNCHSSFIDRVTSGEWRAVSNESDRRPEERRSENREPADPLCRAIVRVSGIPVFEFPLHDVSRNGTCFVVAEDSAAFRHLKVGQMLEIRYQHPDESKSTVLYRSEVRHITRAAEDRLEGHYLIGVRIVSELSIS
jgi:hypothetical protein